MKRGLLVYRINQDDPGNIGVINKCTAQYQAFSKAGFMIDRLCLSAEGVLLNETIIFQKKLRPHSLSLYRFYFLKFGNLIAETAAKNRYDFIYLRHPFFDPLLVRALRRIKRINSAIKIFLEINTYPYDAEPKRLLHRWSLKMDQYYRGKAYEYIDRIIDYGQQEMIWDIPTINIRNGIAVHKVQQSQSRATAGILRLIAVGNWSYWHGLDRLLKGLSIYYQKKRGIQVQVKIVGEGAVSTTLKKMTEQLDLTNYVEFLPTTKGRALDQLFETADIGIGTLGLHRKGVSLDSSLKHREYCARGIPFILSAKDLDFPEDLTFIKYAGVGENAIDIQSITGWYSEGLKRKARQYAEENISWHHQLAPVFEWIRS